MVNESHIIDVRPAQDLMTDLIAVFSVLEDNIKDLLSQALNEKWTNERLLQEIFRLVEE